jgi:hypothetical protein
VIELPEFQTSVFGDSCMLWVLLFDKHSASSSCNIDGGRRGNDGQPGEDGSSSYSIGNCILLALSQSVDVLY